MPSACSKYKLGFIDGRCKKPEDEDSEAYQKWLRCDYMMAYWLMNSMTPQISDNFGYADTAKELWEDVTERYGQSNGSGKSIDCRVLWKLKRIWDEIQSLEGYVICKCGGLIQSTCDILKQHIECDVRDKLMDFLMGLNEGFDNFHSQILGMDPLPSVNKAYYLLMQCEKQKQITGQISLSHENTALAVNKHAKVVTKSKDNKKDKSGEKCTHCNRKGHTVDQCFKLHGYPEWYEKLKAKTGKFAGLDPSLITAIYQELLKRSTAGSSSQASSNYTTATNFVGPVN